MADTLTPEQTAQLRGMQIKAATAGFTQSLINNGYTPEMAQNAAILYASEGGLLHKRASNIAKLREGILAKAAALHQSK